MAGFVIILALLACLGHASALSCKQIPLEPVVDSSKLATVPFGGAQVAPLALGPLHGTSGADMLHVRLPPGEATPAHRHLNEEYMLTLSGGGLLEYMAPGSDEKVEYQLKAGDFHYVPVNGIHAVTNTGTVDWVFIVVLAPPPTAVNGFQSFPSSSDEEGSPPLPLFGAMLQECPKGYELDDDEQEL